MKYLKTYEDLEEEISFIPNDLIPFFEEKLEKDKRQSWRDDDIKDFLTSIILNKTVGFYCEHCIKNDGYGEPQYIYSDRQHKSIVREVGFGIDDNQRIYLTLTLIKYSHMVDTNKPITIYGTIDPDLKKIIEDLNIFSSTKKFNI